MDAEPILLIDKDHPHCTVLTLNRPAKRNALNIELMKQLCLAIEDIENTPNQRAIILKGAGQVFCAGLDLSEAQDHSLEDQSAKMVAKVLKTIYECSLITIAAIHGAALAGGAGIVCACDLAIAETGTFIGLPETRRGLVAAQILPYILRLLPRRLLSELMFLGENIEAHRAYEIGFINKVSAHYASLPDALKFVESLVQGAPNATKCAKKLMQELEPVDFQKGAKLGFDLHVNLRKNEEFKEGIQAFKEKRPPYWLSKLT